MSKSSVAKRSNKRFAKMSEDDAEWLLTQHECVLKLWIEASLADPFGENFKPLKSHLKETSFKRARLALEDEGLFEFEPQYYGRDRRKIQYWRVKNLHGSEMDYWKAHGHETPAQSSTEPLEIKEIPCQERHAIDQERHAIDQERHAIDQERHAIESETLSLSNSCPPLDLIRFNKTDRDLEGVFQDSSSTDRSGRLELDSFAKATESAPSPDAEITRKETRSFATEEDPWNDPTPLVDNQNSRNCEERLVGMNEEKNIAIAPKDDGSVETNITPPISRTFRDENAPEPAPTSPPVESGTEPLEPAAKPHVAASESVSGEVYREARRKYQDRGLNFRYSDQNWSAFEKALKSGKLHPVPDFFIAKGWTHALELVQLNLMSDYLFYDQDPEIVSEPQVCIRDNSELKLIPWSHLPAIVSKSVPEVKKVQSR